MTYFCANIARLAEYSWQNRGQADAQGAPQEAPKKSSISKAMRPTAAVDTVGGLTLLTLGLIRAFAPHAVPFVGSFSQPFMIAGIAVLGSNGAIKIVKECAEDETKPAASAKPLQETEEPKEEDQIDDTAKVLDDIAQAAERGSQQGSQTGGGGEGGGE